jgi:hypothetical protein
VIGGGVRLPIANTLDISVSLYHDGTVRTTITLDQDVYEATVHLSRVSGERLGKVLSDLARAALKTPTVPQPTKGRRFPVFDVPAGAPVIPASRVQRLIDEEPF